ncbi:MAG: NAD-dependent epimerase/dehydratase family protein [Myxococcales bacterium]|nr:NAD-dependent epimerase/dehydratase family protein [Myxococcales bacterium]
MGEAYERCRGELRASPRSWLVTGVAGFIGSHLLHELLSLGQRVCGLDSLVTGKRANLEAVRAAVGADAWSGFRFVEGDICDLATCRDAAESADVVLHQAALGSVPRSIERPLDTHGANVTGSVHVFLAAAERELRVVYASSSSVYGDARQLPQAEELIGAPLSPYAASKRIDEIYAQVYGRSHGLQATGLRYFNVVGSRQDPEGPYAAVVPKWLAILADGGRPVIYGDGETTRDFCPVANVVQANLLAATRGEASPRPVYNVALGGRTSLNDLYRILRDGCARRGVDCADLAAEHADFRPGDLRDSEASIEAIRADLGYEPVVGLAEALDEVIASELAARGLSPA